MRYGFLYSLVFLISCGWSCIKPNKPVQYLSQEIKDYTDYKTGSYWVYQDTKNSANQDSISLIYHNQFIIPGEDGADGPGPSEAFNDTFVSSLNGKFMGSGSGSENYYYIQYHSWPNFETIYFIPKNGEILDAWGNLYLENSSEHPIIAGKQYYNVKDFIVNPQGGSNIISPLKEILWAKNIGVIQKTDSTTTWQLIRYHVVQ